MFTLSLSEKFLLCKAKIQLVQNFDLAKTMPIVLTDTHAVLVLSLTPKH